MKVLVKSAWGSDDPTKAAFPFLHANALAEAGHEVQIFLLGEGVSLMRTRGVSTISTGSYPVCNLKKSTDTPTSETIPRLPGWRNVRFSNWASSKSQRRSYHVGP
jgi:predicted peroxiredoxin